MGVTTADIKELRQKTGAGMMDCKKALVECEGNAEAAVDWLRKKGLSAAAKKSGRVVTEGLVAVSTDAGKGVIIELNAETDFLAKNDKFQNLAQGIAKAALDCGASDIDAINAAPYPDSSNTVADQITESISVIGENIMLRRATELEGQNIVTYIHNSAGENIGKIAAMVAFETEGDVDKAGAFVRQIAMHVAAMRPEALDVKSLDPTLVERERDVLSEQARASGKPENVIEKMIDGRIRKFYAEVVLMEQAFVIDGKTPVNKALQEAESDIGGKTTITGYCCFVLGEGVEKKEEDFAAEVAAAASGV